MNMKWIIVVMAVAFAVLATEQPLPAQGRGTLTIAAASDLQTALPDVAKQFERATGVKVALTFGSSGNFFAQIQNGAPFDVFLSADADYPRKLEAAGLAEPGTLYEYALGRIVIWMPADSRIDLSKLGWHALLDPSVQKIS